MAAVVVIQAWLQGPEGAVIRRQVTMVTAERWREQRVLLATYTQCPDKTAPTLRVATYTWPISPAGTDPYGMWGIHVAGEADSVRCDHAIREAARWRRGAQASRGLLQPLQGDLLLPFATHMNAPHAVGVGAGRRDGPGIGGDA